MSKIQMTTPLVEMDGDEMTRILWQMIKEELLFPYIDLKTEYYDLGLKKRNETNDQITVDSANATKKYGVAVKCATITPNAARMEEYDLKEMWKSRAPIVVNNIKPNVRTWEKPITIARHAYGDVYKSVEIDVPSAGTAKLVFTGDDGKVIEEGKIDGSQLNIGPNEKKTVTIKMPEIKTTVGAEYFLDVDFRLKKDELWAKAGHSVAHEQFGIDLGQLWSTEIDVSTMEAHKVTKNNGLTIEGSDFKIKFDEKSGTLASYVLDGDTIIKNGGRPNFWRAPIDNDKGFNMERGHGEWRKASNNRSVTSEVKEVSARETQVTFNFGFPDVGSTRMKLTYTVYGSGDIVVEYTLNPDGSKSYLPNVGTLFTVPGGYEKVRYFGRGPDENYIGRNRGSFMGLYSTYADSMTVMYMEIGETGQRTDVKWATLTNEKTGKGLMIVGNPRMEFSAQHYTPEQLTNVKLPWELKRDKDITLRVDLHQMGVGGINSWGAEPLNAYRLNANREYSHKFRIAPIRKQLNDPTEYSLLGFTNFGWNKEIPPAKYGRDEINKIYENQPDKDITEGANPDTEGLIPVALPGKIRDLSVAEKNYNVFDAQGKKVGAFTTRGVEDLHAITSGLVKNSGVYIVKSKNGGQAFRITVKK